MEAMMGAVLRHALGGIGGALVAKGVISASMVEPVIGSIMTLAAVVWSLIRKKQAADA